MLEQLIQLEIWPLVKPVWEATTDSAALGGFQYSIHVHSPAAGYCLCLHLIDLVFAGLPFSSPDMHASLVSVFTLQDTPFASPRLILPPQLAPGKLLH